MQLGIRKGETRISLNHEDVWELGREWEMQKRFMDKGMGNWFHNIYSRTDI